MAVTSFPTDCNIASTFLGEGYDTQCILFRAFRYTVHSTLIVYKDVSFEQVHIIMVAALPLKHSVKAAFHMLDFLTFSSVSKA